MSRHHDIALMSMYMTDTFCSFMRNVIFQSCFLLSESPRSDGSPLSGESPASGNHIVWTLAGTCPRVPTKHVGFRGRKSTLGLVIDIAQLFSSNVCMREMCWHGDLTQSRCAQQKPLNRDCPRQAGAFDDRVDGRS